MRPAQIADRVNEWGGYAKAAERASMNPGTLYHLANGTRRATRRQLRRLGLLTDDRQVVAFHLPPAEADRLRAALAMLGEGRREQAEAICKLIVAST